MKSNTLIHLPSAVRAEPAANAVNPGARISARWAGRLSQVSRASRGSAGATLAAGGLPAGGGRPEQVFLVVRVEQRPVEVAGEVLGVLATSGCALVQGYGGRPLVLAAPC
ncbi:MAG: hypothetical protein U0797_20420 [Gemmataceae bacterium]